MKAEINKEGVLILSAETDTESYAINCWLKENNIGSKITNGIGSITYDFGIGKIDPSTRIGANGVGASECLNSDISNLMMRDPDYL